MQETCIPPIYPIPCGAPTDVRARPMPFSSVPDAGDAAAIQEFMRSWPPHYFAPFGSQPIDEPANIIPVALGGGASMSITLPVVSNNKVAVLWAFGLQTSDTAVTRVTSQVNAVPVAPFARRIGAIGTLESPTRLLAPIIVPMGGVFTLLIENTGVPAITVAARFQGWWL
jgi:hypothetical protein